MQWWAWIAVGAILLGSELTFVNAQFYLVFVGASALVVGILALAGAATADWLQWLIFAALAVTSLLTFRGRVYERMRSTLPVMRSGPAGEIVTLPLELPRGRLAAWSTAAALGARSIAVNRSLPPDRERASSASMD